MDDLEFDFEDEINATDVGQPQQAPETLPDRAKKNYRQVRTHRRRADSVDRHRNNPKRDDSRTHAHGHEPYPSANVIAHAR